MRCLLKRSDTRSTAFFEQREIFVPTESGSLEVVLNDEYRHCAIGRDHNRARRSFSSISSMTAPLSFEGEPGTQEHALERLPVNGCQSQHYFLCRDRQLTSLQGNPGRATPFPVGVACVARFLEHLLERARIRAAIDERVHRLIHRGSRCFWRLAGACDVQWHGVCHKLLAFLPNAHGVINAHCLAPSIRWRPACGNRGSRFLSNG